MKDFHDNIVAIIFLLISFACLCFLGYKIYLSSLKSNVGFEKCLTGKQERSVMPFQL